MTIDNSIVAKGIQRKNKLECKLIDFVISSSNDFIIQMFGIDENRKTYSITVKNYKPFFYIQIPDTWKQNEIAEYIVNIKKYVKNELNYEINFDYEHVHHHKLYGFDGYKQHSFIKIICNNLTPINIIKNLFYDKKLQKLFKNGYVFNGESTYIYEVQIPPLLRYFHIQSISPSGWICVNNYTSATKKKTHCDYEVYSNYRNIVGLNEKEDIVPYKICSFDIEASSSHGDFPLAKKGYNKVAYEIFNYIETRQIHSDEYENILYKLLLTVFDFNVDYDIDNVFLKNPKQMTREYFDECFKKMLEEDVSNITSKDDSILDYLNNIENKCKTSDEKYEDEYDENMMDYEEEFYKKKSFTKRKQKKGETCNIINFLQDSKLEKVDKVTKLTETLQCIYPDIEGDKVTFIGSTFINFQDKEPYLNHCLVLDKCEEPTNENTVYKSCETEKELLMSWRDIILEEDPDIIIGYNIFGFDYKFMFERAEENGCKNDFCQISRNHYTSTKLKESSIVIASGQHDLKYIEMPGRLQIDMYNYFRRDFNLSSYKLDNVAAEFLSDKISKIEYDEENGLSKIYTKNMKGLEKDGFVRFEILDHSNTLYNNGEKFKVLEMDQDSFIIKNKINYNNKYSLKWSLAKDDVTPQDIFRLTNEGPAEKSIIAKYCIQDCNLVHHLFKKIDVMTTYIEMSKICSVPISFLVFRGQGIKLTSYIAKKCREKDTLMPLISKGNPFDAYEGAIVLEPKTGLYLDNPVACVDYSSLYPSSIISENISHDSKVWTKEIDLNGNIVHETGEKDENGKYIYDNLSDYKYVDIKYETFGYKRLSPTAKASKVKTGYKICRFAQFQNGKAIMPSILEELLAARKATKKQMKTEKDPFMQNILDKRQLSIKVTANSLYGQCGAKTSTFYEMDVAASTTATGRKLLHYAKEIIENVYTNYEIESKYGKMISNAEYIYGDTDSVFFTFNLKDSITGKPVTGQKALEVTIDMAKEAGNLATKFLKNPHDLEYEKTFLPFCLLSKKRYVGMLYEEDPNKCYRKSMGIVLKRRDNAPIVKDVYGGIIDILMNEKDVNIARDYLDNMLDKLIKKEVNVEKLIISKSLRAFYKNPNSIAHKVLANRIAERDPGNKPSAGDRIPYIYIINNNKKALQGEKIETPQYIKDNKIKIDYGFYISNQIMNPVSQLFALVLYEMKEFKRKKNGFIQKLETMKENLEYDKYIKKEQELKNKEIENIMFKKYLIHGKQQKLGNRDIMNYFTK